MPERRRRSRWARGAPWRHSRCGHQPQLKLTGLTLHDDPLGLDVQESAQSRHVVTNAVQAVRPGWGLNNRERFWLTYGHTGEAIPGRRLDDGGERRDGTCGGLGWRRRCRRRRREILQTTPEPIPRDQQQHQEEQHQRHGEAVRRHVRSASQQRWVPDRTATGLLHQMGIGYKWGMLTVS